MNAQTLGWFVFLAISKNCAYAAVYFKLDDSNLTAIEGSCIEIKCKVTYKVSDGGYWFWMKNRKWDEDKRDFIATIIYSTNKSIRPVNPNYASRVKYTGSPPSSWIASQNIASNSHPACNILICDLDKTDRGNYSLRFIGIGSEKWATDEVSLTVTENPCPITFEKPPAVKASDRITLTCSTLSSCPSDPEIKGQTPPSETLEQRNVTRKSTTVSFQTGWQDDGKEFSCQAKNNKDVYLIQNINITVEYAPQNVLAEKSPTDIKEGELVILTCSAKGRPDPTFIWQKDGVQVGSEPKLTFQSIRDSDSEEYRCEAKNKHGTEQSGTVSINVTYAPEVEIKMTPSVPEVNQGDEITLTCNVTRSNPKPDTFAWFKDGNPTDWKTSKYVKTIEARDKGLYKCAATNRVGTGTSRPLTLTVRYPPSNLTLSMDTDVREGQHITIKCTVDSYPLSELKLTSTSNPQRLPGIYGDNALQHSFNVTSTDEGLYTCHAQNEEGSVESTPRTLVVRYPVQHCGPQSAALPWAIAAISLILNVICMMILWNTRKKVKPNEEDRTYMSLQKIDLSPEYDVIGQPLN